MSKERMLEVLKRKQRVSPDERTRLAMTKMQKQKRLSSEEFLRVHDALWKDGPKIKYQNPDAWDGVSRE